MSKCTLEDLTIDANVYGSVREVETFNGGVMFVATDFRSPIPYNLACANCGEDIPVQSGADAIHEAIKNHISIAIEV